MPGGGGIGGAWLVLLVVGGGASPGGGSIPYLILNTYYIYIFCNERKDK